MEIFKELTKKGYKHYYEGTIEELDLMDKNNSDLHSEIMQVLMWLYEKHGIWIQGPFPYNDGKWEWVIFLLKEPLNGTDGYKNIMSLHHHPYKFNSPTEAYEAAIKYVLTKFI